MCWRGGAAFTIRYGGFWRSVKTCAVVEQRSIECGWIWGFEECIFGTCKRVGNLTIVDFLSGGELSCASIPVMLNVHRSARNDCAKQNRILGSEWICNPWSITALP